MIQNVKVRIHYLVAFWQTNPLAKSHAWLEVKSFFWTGKSCWVLVYSALLYKCGFQVMHVMCGLENFHPAGSWNGWMPTSDYIMDRPPMMWLYCSGPFAVFNKLWTIYCSNGPYRYLVLIGKALRTLLHGSFNAYVRSSLCYQVIYRALTRQHSTGWFFIIA
jgi:hypothetical protein